jgi:type IV pilus assembly protein PilM
MATNPKAHKVRLACEIAADRVVAARATPAGDMVEACTARTVPAGSVVPSLTAANIADSSALRGLLADALTAVGGRGREVVAIVPDAACRVALLDFDSLPDKPQEAEAVVRFRLDKALPFEVEKARVSYHVQRANGALNVVAAVALTSVLDEYETVLREAGYTPGVVVPSILAALGQVDASAPTLIIKVDATSTGVAIVNRDQLLLVRTIENPAGARVTGEQLAEDVFPSVVFFQDTYGTKLQRVLVGGLASPEAFGAALQEQTGVRVQELVNTARLTTGALTNAPRSALAGVLGALVA